jgi:hypothetical protein
MKNINNFDFTANTSNMFYVYVSESDGYSNETLCDKFSFSNTIINEHYIKCQQTITGDTLTLRRDGEIRLFEFRPLSTMLFRTP